MRTLIAGLTVAALMGAPDKLFAQAARERVNERVQDINLTDAQEAKIADIAKEFRPKIQEAAKELAAVLKAEGEKIQATLTPAQKTKLETLKEERQEHRAEGLAQRLAHLGELDLTDAELAKIGAIRAEYAPKIARAMEGLHGLLSEDQRKAREEALQAGKPRREVLAALKLTGAQKEKVEAVGKEVRTLVREELAKVRDVLSEGQKEKLEVFQEERKAHVRDRMAHAIMNFKDLDLTTDQKTQLADIRKEYRPKVQEAGNKLRAAVRQEVQAILAVLKG